MELQWGLHRRQVRSTLHVIHIHLHIPALGVVNITSDATSILLPNTLNVVVTVTV